MLSAGMFSALAAAIAVRRRGFMSGSPPLLAAIAISLMRRVKILPRLASSAPFLCLIVAHFEWPDISRPLYAARNWPSDESTKVQRHHVRKRGLYHLEGLNCGAFIHSMAELLCSGHKAAIARNAASHDCR